LLSLCLLISLLPFIVDNLRGKGLILVTHISLILLNLVNLDVRLLNVQDLGG